MRTTNANKTAHTRRRRVPVHAAGLLLVLSGGSAQAAPPELVHVPSTTVRVGDVDARVAPFQIEKRARRGDGCPDGLEVPTAAEWAVAASTGGFQVSNLMEQLDGSDFNGCITNMEVMAEGVAGQEAFGGRKPNNIWSTVIQGPDAARSVVTVSMVDFHFRSNEQKQIADRIGSRCVRRTKPFATRFVRASRLSLRAAPSKGGKPGKKLASMAIGSSFEVRAVKGDWTFGQAAWDDGPGRSCRGLGWVSSAFLVDEAPDFERLVLAGERALREERHQEASTELERASALRPEVSTVLDDLLMAYQQSGNHEAAARLQKGLARRHKKFPVRVYEGPGSKEPMGLATYCRGEPAKARFVRRQDKTAKNGRCYLEWRESSHHPPHVGSLKLDPLKIGEACGGPVSELGRQTVLEAKQLFIKVRPSKELTDDEEEQLGADAGRLLVIRSRGLRQRSGDGDYFDEGYGLWRTIRVTSLQRASFAASIPVSTITKHESGFETYAAELHAAVYDLARGRTEHQVLVRITWPANC